MSTPLYTTGASKTVLIAGLGNPGKKYEGTRHNVGFVCLDAFAEAHEFPAWTEKKDLKCLLAVKLLGESRVILCKPATYMNLSGEAVQKIAHFYKIAPDDTVVVYDELDIPFGQIRMRTGGSDAGHNGIRSLIQHVGSGFGRVRVGIGKKESGIRNQESAGKPETDDQRPETGDRRLKSADFVLSKFSKEEQAEMSNLTREAVSILTEYVYRGELTPETRGFIA